MVGMFDNLKDWEIAEELGVANYGQMTAGGWMYIGPQGIVHGTFNTILGAGRKYLGVAEHGDLAGKLFVSSGLGGMSGAQPKAANIANAVGVFAEVDLSRIKTRYDQGWVNTISDNLDEVFAEAKQYLAEKNRFRSHITEILSICLNMPLRITYISICFPTRLPATMSITAVIAPSV